MHRVSSRPSGWRVRGPHVARKPRPWRRVRGSSRRRGNFLPSACLFLQERGNGSRTSGQHSCGPWKAKPFPESYCFVASTEPPALLEKRNHLAREVSSPRVNVHKHVEAVGRTLVDPLLHKVDNLLRGAEPIMSTTASGDNLTNGDGSVLQQTVSRCPMARMIRQQTVA